MKNLLRFLFLTVLALCMYVPSLSTKAEAANIVVLPVVNNVDYHEIEATYYDNVIDCIKQQKVYELIDNDAITATIDKYAKKGVLPDLAAMQKISEEANADLVVAMELDKLSLTKCFNGGRDDNYDMCIEGKTVSYNVADGKIVTHPFGGTDMIDLGFYTRRDVPLKWWADSVQREMHKVLKYKGMGLKKQNLGGVFK